MILVDQLVNMPILAASPFVVAVTLGGVPIFADIINGCLLVFTLSAASSGMPTRLSPCSMYLD